jgi:hypothetical protein
MIKYGLLALVIVAAAIWLFAREGPDSVPTPGGRNEPVHIEPPNPLD